MNPIIIQKWNNLWQRLLPKHLTQKQRLSIIYFGNDISPLWPTLKLKFFFNFSLSNVSISSLLNSIALQSEPELLGGPLSGGRSSPPLTTENAWRVCARGTVLGGIFVLAILLPLPIETSSMPHLFCVHQQHQSTTLNENITNLEKAKREVAKNKKKKIRKESHKSSHWKSGILP